MGLDELILSQILELLHIALYDGVGIHGVIHSRSNNHRRMGRHYRGGEHIVRNAICNLTDHIGCAGRNQETIRLPRQRNVLYAPHSRLLEHISGDNVPGQGPNGLLRDKSFRVFCHNDVHICMEIHHQLVEDQACLPCSDAAGNAHDNIFSSKHLYSSFLMK